MVFSSLTFLFIFLPAVMAFYFVVPKKYMFARNVVLLIFNIIFYAYGDPSNCIMMFISIALNYIFGIVINKYENKKAIAKFTVFLAVLLNIGLLVYFKYLEFISNNIYNIFGIALNFKSVLKPIGISFFTFQGLSYVLDVYKKNAPCQKSFFNLALYISLFPQLIAGPIVRYESVAAEIDERESTLSEAADGICRFMAGFAKKVIISNTIGQVADALFGTPVAQLSFLGAWLAPISYAIQIYFDFSAYSDMAIGLGMIFGFHFTENFDYPYISRSITEFWRRWHMTLGSWFRDYVYIPLGGNRCSKIINLRNIFVVWILTGLWHGAAWKFVLWGLYFGVILAIEKMFLGKILKKLPAALQHLYAIVLIIVGWAIFRSYNIAYLIELVKTMFIPIGKQLVDAKSIYYLTEFKIELIISFIASVPISKMLFKNNKAVRYTLAFVVFIIGIIFLLSSSFNPFIYFRF